MISYGTIIDSVTRRCVRCSTIAILALGVSAGVGSAATLPGVVSTPVGAGVQSVGGAVYNAATAHAAIAPTVVSAAPGLEPFADGVTNGIKTIGSGVATAGSGIQSGGLSLTPVAGAKTAVQTLRDGRLIQAQVGSVTLGKGATSTLVGVGALTSNPPQGTLATAGVANANALLNANVAPQ